MDRKQIIILISSIVGVAAVGFLIQLGRFYYDMRNINIIGGGCRQLPGNYFPLPAKAICFTNNSTGSQGPFIMTKCNKWIQPQCATEPCPKICESWS